MTIGRVPFFRVGASNLSKIFEVLSSTGLACWIFEPKAAVLAKTISSHSCVADKEFSSLTSVGIDLVATKRKKYDK